MESNVSKTRKRSATFGRPPVKQQQIVADLRRRIVSGAIPVAGRLAKRTELCALYNASSVTVQHALSQLMEEGFIVSRGSRGTFVSDSPPHLSRYAIVVGLTPGDASYTHFWTTIEHEARQLRQSSGLNLQIFHGVESHVDNEPFQQLVADVRGHRLAGLIFLHTPFQYIGTPLLDEPGIPRVAFMDPIEEMHGVQAVFTDYENLFVRGLDFLASRSRRRIAVIAQPHLPGGHSSTWIRQQVENRGMLMEPYWLQFGTTEANPLVHQQVAHLLMHPNQPVRPDGLIIADDNLVPGVTAGLIAAGIKSPTALEVVAHCNFPSPASSVIPVTRLGFDARRVLLECVRGIDTQRRERRLPPPVCVPAVFEDEYSASRG